MLSSSKRSYPALILVYKAEKLRKVAKNWGIHAKQEEIEVDLKQLVEQNLSRPLRLLFTEPIVFLLSLYTAFIYGLLYVFLTAYPIVFKQIRGMSTGVASLPLLAMIVGELFACAYFVRNKGRGHLYQLICYSTRLTTRLTTRFTTIRL